MKILLSIIIITTIISLIINSGIFVNKNDFAYKCEARGGEVRKSLTSRSCMYPYNND
jgi:hypothetical protein